MEETEEKMLVLKKKPKSAVNSRLTPVQRKSNLKKNNSGSNSSLEEFLKLEKQLKTPKSITKQKIKKQEFKLPNHINDIMQKLAENQKLFEEFKNGIEKNNKEINDNLQKILDFINKNENCDASNVQKSTDENTSPNVMPNNCALTKNLRVATLQKNLEKKVIFDLNKNGDDGNRSENQPITLKTIIAQTPKTMFRNVSQKANEQLSKLEDTPKSTFNRFA